MNISTFKSKSFWTGVAMVATGAGMCAYGDKAQGVQTIAGGLATIFVRDAISKLSDSGSKTAQS